MSLKVINRSSAIILLLFSYPLLAHAQKARPTDPLTGAAGKAQPALWREPAEIKTRDLFYGPGGKDRQPQGKLTFIEEDMDGTNPKFSAEDERGVRWKVKLGVEAQPETVATRLVWAVGYFADEDYYLPQVSATPAITHRNPACVRLCRLLPLSVELFSHTAADHSE